MFSERSAEGKILYQGSNHMIVKFAQTKEFVVEAIHRRLKFYPIICPLTCGSAVSNVFSRMLPAGATQGHDVTRASSSHQRRQVPTLRLAVSIFSVLCSIEARDQRRDGDRYHFLRQ
jgi:hypothetical protein